MSRLSIEKAIALPVAEAAGRIPTIEDAEMEALVSDMREHGQRVPIVLALFPENHFELLDGRHRLEALRRLGAKDVTYTITPVRSAVDAFREVISLNVRRRHLSESQRALLGASLVHEYEAESGSRRGFRTDLRAHVPEGLGVRARDEAAEVVGVSGRLVGAAETVLEHGAPDVIEAVRRGDVVVTAAAELAQLPAEKQAELLRSFDPKLLRKEARRLRQEDADRRDEERRREAVARPEVLTGSEHRLVLGPNDDVLQEVLAVGEKPRLVHADPPWSYSNQIKEHGSTERHYGSEDMEAIVRTLNAAHEVAADDAYLLLWVTFPVLSDWMATAGASELRWTYKTGGAWTKDGAPGIGFHWRGNAELLLVYVKGNPRPVSKRPLVNKHASATGRHSEKPEVWLREILEAWTDEGDLVLDLWAGLAPMLRAARATGRRYIGAEIDPARRAEALALLTEEEDGTDG